MRVVEQSADRLPSPIPGDGAIKRYVQDFTRAIQARSRRTPHFYREATWCRKSRWYLAHIYPTESKNIFDRIISRVLEIKAFNRLGHYNIAITPRCSDKYTDSFNARKYIEVIKSIEKN